MNIINLFKNRLDRILTKKEIMIVAFIIIPIIIGGVVWFSNKEEVKPKIALVASTSQNINTNNMFEIYRVSDKPTNTDLIIGNYDAVVEQKENGKYVATVVIKSKADKDNIETFFNTGKLSNNLNKQVKRGIGTTIIGMLIMLLIAQGVALTITYPEDRTKKTFRRILTAPVSARKYLFAQGFSTFIFLYIPTYLAIVITKVCFGVDIGFNLIMLAILIAIITALATTFSVFISAVLENNISIAATGIALITCALGNCFNSFSTNNKVLDIICNIIPQKSYMTLIQGIENGKGMFEFKGQIIYIFICIVLFWILGSSITKNRMENGLY